MATPQQPELARSRRSAADPASAKSKAGGAPATGGPTGPVPEDNLPGHHPEHEQDKPEGPPRRRATTRPAPKATKPKPKAQPKPEARPQEAAPATRRFGFAFEPGLRRWASAVGVTPETAWVEIAGGRLRVRFGRWSLDTDLSNVAGAERTGPYTWFKVAGPPHLSLSDRGVTFATSTEAGACIRFHRPVSAIEPFGLLRHPAATVTVEDPDALVEALRSAGG